MKSIDNLVADTICRTAGIDLTITGTAGVGTITIIDAASMAVSNTCSEYGRPGKLRDHILRRLVDLPIVGFPSHLNIRVPRFLCTATSYSRKIFQASLVCTDDESKLTHCATHWIPQRLAIDQMSVSVTAEALSIGWDLVNQAAPNARHQPVYDDPHHLDGVRALGADEHVWEHIRKPGQPSDPVTILVNLTPLVGEHSPTRLLDPHPGHSVEALRTRLQERDPNLRSQMWVMTMDGFTGYASAVDQIFPDATKVMDPFRVAHLAADKLTDCWQRLQRGTIERHGRKDNLLYKYRWILLTRTSYLTQRQKQRLDPLWATDDDYVALEVIWLLHQDMIVAYGYPKKSEGKKFMNRVIDSLCKGLPVGLEELAQLGRILWRRRKDVLAYFDVGASNGPAESVSGRLEHLCGIVLGFRNLNHYILRCLIHSGQLQGKINALQKRKGQ